MTLRSCFVILLVFIVYNNEQSVHGVNITLLSDERTITKHENSPALESTYSMFKSTVQSLSHNVSTICGYHMKFIQDALNKGESWAVQMVDANGRQPSGMLNGGYKWLGDFDECLNTKAVNLTHQVFTGRFCMIQVVFSRQKNPILPQYPVIGQIAVCVPDTCTEQDALNLALSTLPQKIEEPIKVVNAKCQESNKNLDTKAWTVIYILLVMVTLVLIATTFDIVQRIHLKTSNKKTDRRHISLDNGPEANIVNKTEKGTAVKVLLAFSAYTNSFKVLSTHQGADSLNAINGLRFISMSWIILGHTYAYSTRTTDNYFKAYLDFIYRKSFMPILNADLSVDTFFSISGLLVAYITLRMMKKQNGRLNLLLYYFHRVWRLTPVYMLVLTVYVSLFNYIGSGPLWGIDEADRLPCERYWWYNLLYINNFQTLQDQCLGWTWYLANDMQFFVITPIFVMPLFRSKVAGSVVAFIGILGTTILTGIISFNFDLGISPDTSSSGLDFYDMFYVRPYCRIGPYIIGIYTGYLLYENQSRIRINKIVNLFLWTISAVIACTVLYGIYDETNGNLIPKELAAVYNAVHTSLWGLCICWVVLACSTRHGVTDPCVLRSPGFYEDGYARVTMHTEICRRIASWKQAIKNKLTSSKCEQLKEFSSEKKCIVNSILSWKGFVPLSRLSYSVYLIHPIIIYYYAGTERRILHWTDLEMIYMYLGHTCLSFALAVPVTLLFELPMMQLEKVIFKR